MDGQTRMARSHIAWRCVSLLLHIETEATLPQIQGMERTQRSVTYTTSVDERTFICFCFRRFKKLEQEDSVSDQTDPDNPVFR